MELITRREVIAMLVDDGLSNAEIGKRLGVEEQTIKKYLRRVFGLLEVKNRVQLAAWWHTELFQLGLTP